MFTNHESALTILSIFPKSFSSNGSACIPMSQDQVKKLVEDLGFPDRFFINLMVGRRLSTCITTRTGNCWLMSDWLFSAVTLRRTRNNDLLSIIVSDNQDKHSKIEPVLNRYISSSSYHRHSLFPILLIADAALEDYRDISILILPHSRIKDPLLDFIFQTGGSQGVVYQQDPAAGLADITSRTERLTRLSGNLKAFHASVRDLLNLHDERNMNPGLLHSLAPQAGGQAIPISPLGPMLQYLVSASGDILERITTTDTRLQSLFLAVGVYDRQALSVVLITSRCKSASRNKTLKLVFVSPAPLPRSPWPRKGILHR